MRGLHLRQVCRHKCDLGLSKHNLELRASAQEHTHLATSHTKQQVDLHVHMYIQIMIAAQCGWCTFCQRIHTSPAQ